MRFMLQSADTAANRARTKHNFRKHVAGRFDADFEVSHKSWKWKSTQQRKCTYYPSAGPRGQDNWMDCAANRRKNVLHQQSYGACTLLGRDSEALDAKAESVTAWLNSAPTIDQPVESCDVVQLTFSGAKQQEGACDNDGSTGSQPHIQSDIDAQSSTGAATKPCASTLTGAADTRGAELGEAASHVPQLGAQFDCHVSCDDLVQRCLGK